MNRDGRDKPGHDVARYRLILDVMRNDSGEAGEDMDGHELATSRADPAWQSKK